MCSDNHPTCILIPALTPQDIVRYCGPYSFAQGQAYFEDRCIFRASRQGSRLYGSCHESTGPCNMSCTFDNPVDNPVLVDWHCTCSYKADTGTCVHVAALLLAWCYRAKNFVIKEDWDVLLADKTADELREILVSIAHAHPFGADSVYAEVTSDKRESLLVKKLYDKHEGGCCPK